VKEVVQEVITILNGKGFRVTNQRKAIVEAAFSTTHHYSAEDLLKMSQKLDPAVSRATVYRTLPLLVETGFLQEVDLGKDFKFYDPNYSQQPHHNHIVCVDCDQVFEFDDHCLVVRENFLSKSMGFAAQNMRLKIEAKCEELKKCGVCKKQTKTPKTSH
jgi:Fur family ferric uptake transcriptional regulator